MSFVMDGGEIDLDAIRALRAEQEAEGGQRFDEQAAEDAPRPIERRARPSTRAGWQLIEREA